VDKSTETSLTLNNAVWDTHLAAESREPENQFNGINIVGNNNELGLLGFNKGGDVVNTVLDDNGLVSLGDLLLLGLGSSSSTETITLLGLVLRSVLVHQLEELSGSVLIQNVGELVESWGNLQTLVKDLLLTLKLNVVGPLDETRDITLGLDVLTYIFTRFSIHLTVFSSCIFSKRLLLSKRGKIKINTLPTPKFLGVFSIKGLAAALVVCLPLRG
jgi:hypothetical protein